VREIESTISKYSECTAEYRVSALLVSIVSALLVSIEDPAKSLRTIAHLIRLQGFALVSYRL
jgi:hypothetical protein